MSTSTAGTGGAADDGPAPVRTGHTHLFPGTRLLLDGAAPALRPRALELEFSDGVHTPAELLAPVRPDDPWLLAVESYRTAAGTPLPARSWLVAGVTDREDGTELRLGGRLPDTP
ncbi:hypothetical protein [Streptomyces salyersiae]|uniref:Uncharacterized protein n=1 Tax=Streptomyces salyersiae TaxID=3075530 RepID=A0ABU2RQB3_9ACTN|nr:hypothetical protein [Streptomyces sp. DSM 41770]MDT0431041.1 hypothetical protein [Streptomyces sp. DSM 41770]